MKNSDEMRTAQDMRVHAYYRNRLLYGIRYGAMYKDANKQGWKKSRDRGARVKKTVRENGPRMARHMPNNPEKHCLSPINKVYRRKTRFIERKKK